MLAEIGFTFIFAHGRHTAFAVRSLLFVLYAMRETASVGLKDGAWSASSPLPPSWRQPCSVAVWRQVAMPAAGGDQSAYASGKTMAAARTITLRPCAG
ncbi:MAG: hypothetical protein ABI389_15195 [Rhodanobacter sp.]